MLFARDRIPDRLGLRFGDLADAQRGRSPLAVARELDRRRDRQMPYFQLSRGSSSSTSRSEGSREHGCRHGPRVVHPGEQLRPIQRVRLGTGLIVEQRDYHVTTGKLPELVRLYETEGIAIQSEYLGGFVGAFTVDVGALSTYTSLWRYDSYAEREKRRARLQADERWKAFLAQIQPLIHTQQNRILVPTAFSPLR